MPRPTDMSEKRFAKQADLYAKYRPHYPKDMYSFILEHVPQRHAAWDAATGSGQVAGMLAQYFEQVYANDISKEQLSYAPQESNIHYKNTPAEKSGFQSNTFNLITIAQAIHWLDFDQFYNEVRRTAKTNAVLAVIGYGMIRISPLLNPIIDSLYEEAFQQYFNENRTYLDQHYKTIPFPFEEIPSPTFEIAYEWSLDKLSGYFNSWSAIQKIKSEHGHNPTDETISKLKAKLSEPNAIPVSFPVFLRLARI